MFPGVAIKDWLAVKLRALYQLVINYQEMLDLECFHADTYSEIGGKKKGKKERKLNFFQSNEKFQTGAMRCYGHDCWLWASPVRVLGDRTIRSGFQQGLL